MYTYRGEADRRKAAETARKVQLTPETISEKFIINASRELTTNIVSVEHAISQYVALRNIRHQLWLDFLTKSRYHENFEFQDTKVEEFCAILRRRYDIHVPQPPENIKNKTPDILLYDYRDSTVFLGDVSVSTTYQIANQRKFEKYYPIEKFFKESCNLKVSHHNFIIVDDLSNSRAKVGEFVSLRLIKDNRELLLKTEEFHKAADRLMNKYRIQNESPERFIDLLAQHDNITHVNQINLNIEYDPIGSYTPIRTENEIINMIKEETDKIYTTYFDVGYESANKKFVELYKNFENRPHNVAKSSLKVVHNSDDLENKVGYELVKEYIMDLHTAKDEDIGNYLINILPNLDQVRLMEKGKDYKWKGDLYKSHKVFGPWQYSRQTVYQNNYLTMDMREKLTRGKKKPNEKVEPMTIDPKEYGNSVTIVNNMIKSLGGISKKPSFLDETWDCANDSELDNTTMEKENYDYCKKTCGAQLGHSMSNLYQRMLHVKTSLSTKDNIYVPPNGSFICMMPGEHQPFNKSNADVPLIFITRKKKNTCAQIFEYEYMTETNEHYYFISKLSRLPLNKVAHWDQSGHKIVACSSYLLNQSESLRKVKEKVVGIISLLSLDLHQKTSELLDLLKYVSFMPFANISRLSSLIEDKFDIMLKTNLDVWVIKTIEEFMHRLGTPGNVTGIKERTKFFNGAVQTSSLGMKITIPSFCNDQIPHSKIQDFIEEISMINIVRGKQFYGSQFMDKSITSTAQWNDDYLKEIEKYGNWTEGHDDSPFPFSSKFCFSNDVIYYAQKTRERTHPIPRNAALNKLSHLDYDSYMHNVCALRGCTKERYQRKNMVDLHTTSYDSCLEYYQNQAYNEEAARITNIAYSAANSDYIAQYSMSEKEQRGGGRPIATPTLKTKAMNCVIEKPEQAIGSYTDNNILVAGKHKLKTQSMTYKHLLEEGCTYGKKYVYQCTEDQSKFSENDNTRKYLTYLKVNSYMPDDIKYLQKICLDKMVNREQLIKRMPKNIKDDANLAKYINDDRNGVKAIIGWPQGMLNNISTSIHSIADIWITEAYNKAYNDGICVRGLVHSDDSWFAIACNSEDEFRRFTVFRMLAKKLFCLKLNEKKLWGSKMLGELVSNFNINGEVLVPIGKTVANSFGNLLYQNWVMDVHNQVSTLQQVYRNGGGLGTIIMLSTILRQQILGAYNISSDMKRLLSRLPIELGGYPGCSVYEQAVAGVNAHYKSVYDSIVHNPEDDVSVIVRRALTLSLEYNRRQEAVDVMGVITRNARTNITPLLEQRELDNDDYSSVPIPKRGEVFTAIKHIMPMSNKISKTVKRIKELPFESDGLELLITKPKRLSDALGHLKSQTGTMLFDLASEKYSGNKRRLAMNQAIQATGRTVKIVGMTPMTMYEALKVIRGLDNIPLGDIKQLESAFQDDTNIVDIANNIVHNSTLNITNYDKRRVVNRMPDFEDKFQTIAPIRNVLLYIVDKAYMTSYRRDEGLDGDSIDIVIKDSELLKRRFESYFKFYTTKYACNLIMQQYFGRIQPRLWMHPVLRQDDMQNFLEDLYGKTLNDKINYLVSIDHQKRSNTNTDMKIVQSLYTVAILDSMYDKFKVHKINNVPPTEILRNVDYANLSQEDTLKYGILMKLYFDDNSMLAYYDRNREYQQYYIQEQQRDRGVYYGEFVVVCKFGNTVVKILGKPQDVKIISSTNNVNDILMAMYLFVSRDHRNYKYSSPQKWSSNVFWQSKSYVSALSLVTYGNNVTFIKTTREIGFGLALDIDPNLRFPIQYETTKAIDYQIDQHLRVVHKVVIVSGVENFIKLDNVKQSMSCQLADKIELVNDEIDGFMVQDLLSTKLILHVTMRRSFNAPSIVIRNLLANRLRPVNNYSAINFLISFIKMAKTKFKNVEINEPTQDTVEMDIIGDNPVEFIDKHLDTEPEVLDAIELEYIYDDSERFGAIVKHTELYRFFCKCLHQPLNTMDINQLLHEMLHTPGFKQLIDTLIEEVTPDDITELYSASEMVSLNHDLIYKIVSSNLDIESTMSGITSETVRTCSSDIKPEIRKFSHDMINFISDLVTGNKPHDIIDEFFD